jgi:hypothetical protein
MNPIVMIARPRSGTNALRDILKRSGGITVLGEVFHNRYADERLGFFTYFREMVARDPDLALPSEENRRALLIGYLRRLHELTGTPEARPLLFGVNYNSLHCLNTYWQNAHEPPFLVGLLRQLGWRVIHLIRRDVLGALVSELRAKRLGVWHARRSHGGKAPEVARLHVPVGRLRFELEQREAEIEALEEAFRKHPKALTVTYEELFDATGRPSEVVLARIGAFLDLPVPLRGETDFVKTRAAGIGDMVENLDEIRTALRGSRFERLVG